MIRRFILALCALCLLATPSWAPASFSIYESGAWKSVVLPNIYESGAWKSVNQGWVYEAGAWHLFFTSLSLSASDVSGIENTNVGSCANPLSGTPAAVVTGGSGSFTYAWTYVSGDTNPLPTPGSTILNPQWTSTICTFSGGDVSQDAVWHLLVTDTVTTSTVGANINVHLEYNRP